MTKTQMVKRKKEHSAISHECDVDVPRHGWSTQMVHTDDPDIKYAFCRLYTHVRYEYNVTRVDCANVLQIFVNNLLIFCKYFVNILQIFCEYFANFCEYFENILYTRNMTTTM